MHTNSYHADNITAVLLGGIALVRSNKEFDVVKLKTHATTICNNYSSSG